jgi:hypothetical protein
MVISFFIERLIPFNAGYGSADPANLERSGCDWNNRGVFVAQPFVHWPRHRRHICVERRGLVEEASSPPPHRFSTIKERARALQLGEPFKRVEPNALQIGRRDADAARLKLGPRLLNEPVDLWLQAGRNIIKTHAP